MELKNCLIVLLCAVTFVFCAGCTINTFQNKIQYDSVVQEDYNLSPKDNNNPLVEIDTTGMYHISEPESWILIPKEYALITREIDESSDELKKRDLSKDTVIAYLDAYGSELLAISPDENMEVMLKFKKTNQDWNDLSSQQDAFITEYAEGMQFAFGAESYELVENNNIMWVKLEYLQAISNSTVPADVVRYITVINGMHVFLWGSSYSGELTQQNIEELQNMWNSFILNVN